MGEILLATAIITLVFVLLYIHKKRMENRRYCEMYRQNNSKKRYSKDDLNIDYKRNSAYSCYYESSLKKDYRFNYVYSPRFRKYREEAQQKADSAMNFYTPDAYTETKEKSTPLKSVNGYFRNSFKLEEKKDDKPNTFFNNASTNLNNNNGNGNLARQSLTGLTGMNNRNSISKDASSNANINYKILKLEDFLNNQEMLTSSVENLNNDKKRISLDDISPSLVKFINREEEKKMLVLLLLIKQSLMGIII